jgi:uncharacterized membrane protein YgcG
MRSGFLTVALLLFTSSPAFAHPQHIPGSELVSRNNDIEQRDIIWNGNAQEETVYAESAIEQRDLYKRKGGGGGGGKGGGGSSSSGSSGGKGGSSSSSGSSGSRYVDYWTGLEGISTSGRSGSNFLNSF